MGIDVGLALVLAVGQAGGLTDCSHFRDLTNGDDVVRDPTTTFCSYLLYCHSPGLVSFLCP